jgi:hypothetical protein
VLEKERANMPEFEHFNFNSDYDPVLRAILESSHIQPQKKGHYNRFNEANPQLCPISPFSPIAVRLERKA